MASLAGAWTALVAGFGGMRVQNGSLSFAPRLPDALGRLAFHLVFRGRRLRVEVRATEATYRLLDGSPLKVRHHGAEILLSVDDPVSRPIPPIQAGPRPTQPPGRVPAARRAHARSTRAPA
jgi:alpha,alpha-trehalose phosphorylase